MADPVNPTRVEPTLGTNPPPPRAVEELRAAVESPAAPPAQPTPSPTVQAPAPRSDRLGIDQLSRIEEKAARIEEKYARTETLLQRVQDKLEAASGRMSQAALQADLLAVREEVTELGQRLRNLPGLNSLVFTAIVTALLAAAFTLAAQKYLPGLFG